MTKRIGFGLLLLMSLAEATVLLAQSPELDAAGAELIPFREKRKWGFADSSGTLRIKAKYDTVDFFRAGLAVAGRSGKMGLIDPAGDWVVSRRYATIRFDPRFQYYWLQKPKDGAWIVRLPAGKLLPPAELGQELAAIDRWRQRPTAAAVPHRGYRLDRAGDTYLLHEPGGSSRTLTGTYDTLLIGRPFRFYFRRAGRWGVLSYREETLFPAQFEALEPPSPPNAVFREDSDVYAARREGRWGLVSWEEGTLLPFRYAAVERLPHPTHQLFRLTEGGRQGFYDLTTGKLVPPRYRKVGPFDTRGLARVVTPRGRTGYINWNGTEYFID